MSLIDPPKRGGTYLLCTLHRKWRRFRTLRQYAHHWTQDHASIIRSRQRGFNLTAGPGRAYIAAAGSGQWTYLGETDAHPIEITHLPPEAASPWAQPDARVLRDVIEGLRNL